MSVAELKERHMVATQTVNDLREKLKQKRLQLLDTDGYFPSSSFSFYNCFYNLFSDLILRVCVLCSCWVCKVTR